MDKVNTITPSFISASENKRPSTTRITKAIIKTSSIDHLDMAESIVIILSVEPNPYLYVYHKYKPTMVFNAGKMIENKNVTKNKKKLPE